MSSYEIIHDVSEELRVRLYDALVTTPGLDLGLTSPQENISLVAPGEDGGPDVRVRAYLYHVDVSRHLRNQLPFSAPAQPQSQHQPPLPLQLRYLLTPVQDDEPTNHRMLGRLLQYFNDHPTVTTVLGEGLEGDPGRFPTALRLHIDTLSVEQASALWNAFNEAMRLSFVLLVDAVTVESGLTPARAARVRDLYSVTGVASEAPTS